MGQTYIKYQMILIISFVLPGCGLDKSNSHLNMNLAARHHIQLPKDVRIQPTQAKRLSEDWPYRRDYAWSLWAQLFEVQNSQVYTFQTWYDTIDVKRIFRILLQGLSPEERKQRVTFSQEQINKAELEHIDSLWSQGHWNEERYAQWLEQFQTSQQKRGLTGIQRVLYNRSYVHHVLKHYKEIISCLENNPPTCIPPFPLESMILKTSWKRWSPSSIQGFDLNPHNISSQLGDKQWSHTSVATSEPRLGVIDSVLGSRFFLVGMHMTVKTHMHWLWSTLWWSPNNGILGQDRPDSMRNLDYQMCAVSDYTHTYQEDQFSSDPELGQMLAAISNMHPDGSWCSNPYLEEGDHNNKTNCIGCHQHAGDIYSSDEILAGLTEQLPYFQNQQTETFTNDYNWSLDFANQNIQVTLKQVVDYFDTYDP